MNIFFEWIFQILFWNEFWIESFLGPIQWKNEFLKRIGQGYLVVIHLHDHLGRSPMSRVESSISSEQAPGVDNAHNLRKVCYFHSYRPTHWSGFGKLEKLACLKMMKRGRRAYTDPFLKQHWSQQELSSIHPALLWKNFNIYKSQIL